MANVTKKKAAKSAVQPAPKGKGKQKDVAKKAAKVPSPEPESDDDEEVVEEIDEVEVDEEIEEGDDSSEYDSDEDSENGGVSERGMARLMELVGPEDLEEYELAQLAAAEGEEDEDEDDEEGDESGEEEEEEEDDDEEEEGSDEEEIADESVVMDVADPDTVAVDELGSDVSVDEDAVPMRKVTMNNAPAMRILTQNIKMTDMPFVEHLIIQSKEILEVDPSDDLKRETAFYKLALDAVPQARKLCAKFDIPFSRPNDYYAEMVKSDEHMERVRSKLVEEAQGIKKSEEAKRQRDLKKYGKQIQIEKLKAREQDKKAFQDRVQGLKRKRKEGMELGDEDDFDIELDDGPSGRPGKKGRGQGKDGKPKMPRHARDAKYSLGGGSRRSKQNDKESTNDFGSEHRKTKAGKAKRPGKSRRHSRRK